MSWLGESGSALGIGSGVFDNTTELDPEDDVSLSCAARSIHPHTIAIIVRVCQSIILFLQSFCGLFLNVFLMVLVLKYKKLQTLEFGIALQVVGSGISGSLILFLGLLNSIANRWLFGVHMCRIVGATFFTGFLVRTQSLLLFVIHRFLSVFLPFGYPKRQKKVVITLSIVAWSTAILTTAIWYVFDCYKFQPNVSVCTVAASCSRNCQILEALPHIVTSVPNSVILYTLLFLKAKKAKKAVPPAAGEKIAHDWKATITFFLMFLSTFVLTLPNLALILVISTIYGDEVPLGPSLLLLVASRLLSSLPAVDAIVILRNRDVREIVKEVIEKMFQKWKK